MPKNNTISIENTLREFGLNESETRLYLSSLSLGESNMSDLAKKAEIKRSTCYLIFKSLQNKGLMGSVKTSRGLVFTATSPDSLLSRARTHMNRIEMILPELQALSQKKDNRPKMTYYEGADAYRLAVEDCLKNPNVTIRHIGALSELHQTMGKDYDLQYFVPRRVKQNISLKALYFPDVKSELRLLDDKNELREVRYLPEKYVYNSVMLIYENKVLISSSQKELVTIVIESEEIAKSEQMKFDLIWDLINKIK